MSGHTPGPWRIRVNKNDDQDTCDLSICGDIFVLADISGPQYSHQHANARLITATPDLLEACKALVSARVTIKVDNDAWGLGALAEAESLARAAIAKATGEHQ